MDNKDILTQAIHKAVENGWKFFEDSTLLPTVDWIVPNSICVYNSYLKEKMYIPQGVFIFSHDFAKALWGEELDKTHAFVLGGADKTLELVMPFNYIWHLQQMVIADDPIKYLGENI